MVGGGLWCLYCIGNAIELRNFWCGKGTTPLYKLASNRRLQCPHCTFKKRNSLALTILVGICSTSGGVERGKNLNAESYCYYLTSDVHETEF